jgi:acyl-CoA thioester hydrolase
MELVVPASAIDANGHVNNVQYVQWMQDAAMGRTWIIRSHTIEYLHSAYAGDALTVYTWVADFQKIRTLRKFRFHRPADDTVLAVAATVFIFCDLHTGRPRTIPPEVLAAYPLVSPDREP